MIKFKQNSIINGRRIVHVARNQTEKYSPNYTGSTQTEIENESANDRIAGFAY